MPAAGAEGRLYWGLHRGVSPTGQPRGGREELRRSRRRGSIAAGRGRRPRGGDRLGPDAGAEGTGAGETGRETDIESTCVRTWATGRPRKACAGLRPRPDAACGRPAAAGDAPGVNVAALLLPAPQERASGTLRFPLGTRWGCVRPVRRPPPPRRRARPADSAAGTRAPSRASACTSSPRRRARRRPRGRGASSPASTSGAAGFCCRRRAGQGSASRR